MNMYDYCYEESLKRAVHKIWVLSDLQQGDPKNTESCLKIGMEDFELLGRPAEQVWYLGDAVEGDDPERLKKMCDLQENAFGALDIPLCYTTGNHDYDYMRRNQGKPPVVWFREMVKAHPGWHTTETNQDYYFRTMLGDYPVYFLSDHIGPNSEWLVSHSHVVKGKEFYPYTEKDSEALRAEMFAEEHAFFSAAHYSFAGGNRDHELMDKLLPLSPKHKLHFYGHSHIGDSWGEENIFRRISWVDWHDIPQVDVSSFENIRGEFCRSVLAHIYEDGSMGIFFRNHDEHCFTEAYFPAAKRFNERTDLKPMIEERHVWWDKLLKGEKMHQD